MATSWAGNGRPHATISCASPDAGRTRPAWTDAGSTVSERMPVPCGAKVIASVASAMPYDGKNDRASKPTGPSLAANSRSVFAWIGSAPQPVMRMQERSNPTTSFSFSRFEMSANAKLGA